MNPNEFPRHEVSEKEGKVTSKAERMKFYNNDIPPDDVVSFFKIKEYGTLFYL